MIVSQKINMNLDEHGVPPWIDAVQGDAYVREMEVNLFSGGKVWEIPADVKVLVHFRKPDGHGGEYDTLPDGASASRISGNTVTIVLVPQMLTAAGLVRVNVSLIDGITEISTFQICINVHPNVEAELAESEGYYHVSGFLPMAVNAEADQFIRVKAVDEQGIVRDVEAVDIGDAVVEVPTNQSYNTTSAKSTVARYSYPVQIGQITLGEYSCYRINRIGVIANPGSAVRFALFEVRRNEDNTGILTQIEVIGNAIADSETGLASLVFEEGYDVSRDNTIIMALAQEQVIQCYQGGGSFVTSGLLKYNDDNYFAAENGAEIRCLFTTAETSNPSDVWFSLSVCDIDFITEQTLEQYIKDTAERLVGIDKEIDGLLPTITASDNGKVLTAVDGKYKLAAAPSGGAALPAVTAADNGKFLQVVDGIWAAASGGSSELPAFDLDKLGLSTVTIDGETQLSAADTAEIRSALDKGTVKFIIPVNYGGMKTPISCVMGGAQMGGEYICTHTVEFGGEIMYATVTVADNGIGVSVTAHTKYLDAYMEEALGGDY